MHGLLLAGSRLNLVVPGKILKSSNAVTIYIGNVIHIYLIELPATAIYLLVAVPPETDVILNVTSLSISPSIMVAHTSLKASFSLGVVYSLAVNAMVIPVLECDA